MMSHRMFCRLGLWNYCFRSLPDPLDQHQRRFFVGCRWVYDPFTTGYDKIRGYLLPGDYISDNKMLYFGGLCNPSAFMLISSNFVNAGLEMLV